MTKTLSHIVLALIVFIWVVPFVALVSTSMRSEVAAKTSGFWTSFTPTELGHRFATHERGGTEPIMVMRGNIMERINAGTSGYEVSGDVKSILIKTRIADPENPGKTKLVRKLVPAGETMDVRGGAFVFDTNGDFTWTFDEATAPKPKNLDVFIDQDPAFGADAYIEVLFDNKNVPNALISSFIVTIPATIIPITIAAFAAYAFAWMQFPGRDWLFVIVVSLMVVPTQLAFLPILQGFSGIASWATALNQWLTDCELTDSCQVASKPLPVFGSPIRPSACLWRFICSETTSWACPKSFCKARGLMEPAICKSSRGSSCRCPCRLWPLLASSNSFGFGTI